MFLKKIRHRKCLLEIETIAEEFFDSASRNQYTLWIVLFKDVERQYKGVEEFRNESIVGWRCECEEVGGAVFRRGERDGTGERAVGGVDGDGE